MKKNFWYTFCAFLAVLFLPRNQLRMVALTEEFAKNRNCNGDDSKRRGTSLPKSEL